jgi:hypothetical protein
MEPKCPYCEVEWPNGPITRDEAEGIRVVYCPSCARVVAVVPTVVVAVEPV